MNWRVKMERTEFNKRFGKEKAKGVVFYDNPHKFEPGIEEHILTAFKLQHVLPTNSCQGHLIAFEAGKGHIDGLSGKKITAPSPEAGWIRKDFESIPKDFGWIREGHLVLLFDYSDKADNLIKKIKAMKEDFPNMVIKKGIENSPLSPIQLDKETLDRLVDIRFHPRDELIPLDQAKKAHEKQLEVKQKLLEILKGELDEGN